MGCAWPGMSPSLASEYRRHQRVLGEHRVVSADGPNDRRERPVEERYLTGHRFPLPSFTTCARRAPLSSCWWP